ncbi:hypothetical protein MesoLj113b_72650 (plasmid) [Mesorhizobium sp. 113-3-3]|nr:hypothetical protein MesoLj113b_72650 [Mesorhizobium sp. 113-3-3]
MNERAQSRKQRQAKRVNAAAGAKIGVTEMQASTHGCTPWDARRRHRSDKRDKPRQISLPTPRLRAAGAQI